MTNGQERDRTNRIIIITYTMCSWRTSEKWMHWSGWKLFQICNLTLYRKYWLQQDKPLNFIRREGTFNIMNFNTYWTIINARFSHFAVEILENKFKFGFLPLCIAPVYFIASICAIYSLSIYLFIFTINNFIVSLQLNMLVQCTIFGINIVPIA